MHHISCREELFCSSTVQSPRRTAVSTLQMMHVERPAKVRCIIAHLWVDVVPGIGLSVLGQAELRTERLAGRCISTCLNAPARCEYHVEHPILLIIHFCIFWVDARAYAFVSAHRVHMFCRCSHHLRTHRGGSGVLRDEETTRRC